MQFIAYIPIFLKVFLFSPLVLANPELQSRARLPRLPIEARTGDHAELNGLPVDSLIDIDWFYTGSYMARSAAGMTANNLPSPNWVNYSHDGWLYNGRASHEDALDILTNGPLDSIGNPKANYGRGFYFSHDIGKGLAFSSEKANQAIFLTPLTKEPSRRFDQGVVLKYRIRKDPKINILDYARYENLRFFKNLAEAYDHDLTKIFPVLREQHGIDIVINGYVIVLNANVLEAPRSLAAITQNYREWILDSSLPPGQRMSFFVQWQTLEPWAVTLTNGVAVVIPEQFAKDLESIGKDKKNPMREDALNVLGDLADNKLIFGYENFPGIVKVRAHFGENPKLRIIDLILAALTPGRDSLLSAGDILAGMDVEDIDETVLERIVPLKDTFAGITIFTHWAKKSQRIASWVENHLPLCYRGRIGRELGYTFKPEAIPAWLKSWQDLF